MFGHLYRDDSNKWSNIGFGEEINVIEMKIHTLSGSLLTETERGQRSANGGVRFLHHGRPQGEDRKLQDRTPGALPRPWRPP